uniref:Putative receptor-like protein kinase At5g39030 n=1 Tax=Rhizophora mucronata TaxID=61149 RepID=A0A2P2MVV3_RHIMU
MMNPSNCGYFTDEILSITLRLTQHFYCGKTPTTELSFEH